MLARERSFQRRGNGAEAEGGEGDGDGGGFRETVMDRELWSGERETEGKGKD